MPQRNLLTVVCLSLVCLACYSKAPTNRYARVYEQALRIVDKHYVTPQDKQKLFEASLHGMMQSLLDEHSVYLPPVRLDEMNQKLEQVYGGIGIRIDFDPNSHRLQVISPILDSPAFKAGIQPGDVIVQIDGVNTKDLTVDKCIARMKGPIDEMIRLTVQRGNELSLREFNLKRAQISVPSVLGQTRNKDGSWNYLLEEDDRILYLHITDFGRDTLSELRQVLETDKLGYEAVVIDLRDNGGGLLETAINVCDMFIAEGVIVSTRGRGGTLLEEFKAESKPVIDRAIPMAILINDNSASASEIMAGCLQDHKRAVIVGERSYGKGSVQNIIEIDSGRSAIKLTTASFWRPSLQNIQRSPGATEDEQWGIRPDKGFEVVFTEEDWKRYRVYRYRYSFSPDTFQPRTEDLEAPGDGDLTDPRPAPEPNPVDFKDRQLDRALEYLRDELQKQDVVLLSPR